MKKGLDVGQLTSKLEFQHENKRDLLCGTEAMTILVGPGEKMELRVKPMALRQQYIFTITNHALAQIVEFCEIPMDYATKLLRGTLRERQSLAYALTVCLNEHPAVRMVRTVPAENEWGLPSDWSIVRAFVHDRYRPIPNINVLTTVMEVVRGTKGAKVVSSWLGDTHMLLKIDIGGNKGIFVSNSEVGVKDNLTVMPMMFDGPRAIIVPIINLIAENIVNDYVNREGPIETNIPATIRRTLDSLMGKESQYVHIQTRMLDGLSRPITGDPASVLSALAAKMRLSDEEVGGTLGHLKEMNQLGLARAVSTFASRKHSLSYEKATELEQAAGAIVLMPLRVFGPIATAGGGTRGTTTQEKPQGNGTEKVAEQATKRNEENTQENSSNA